MSIFESVIAKFNQAMIIPSWKNKLVEISSLIDENLVVFKDKNEILNVKGPFHVLLTEKSKDCIHIKLLILNALEKVLHQVFSIFYIWQNDMSMPY